MIKNIRGFILFAVTLTYFSVIAVPVILQEFREFVSVGDSKTLGVEKVYGETTPGDLTYTSGDSVVGMVRYALDGEYELNLDGIHIDQNTDPEYVNFSGVVGRVYKIQVESGADGKSIVTATVQ